MKRIEIELVRKDEAKYSATVTVENIDEFLKKSVVDIVDECETQALGNEPSSTAYFILRDLFLILKVDAAAGLLSVGTVRDFDRDEDW